MFSIYNARMTSSPFSFTDGAYWQRLKKGQHERLVKLCKPARHSAVLDMTAGLLQDSLILARCGYQVTALERNEALYKIAQNALARFTEETGFQDTSARIQHLLTEATEWMADRPYDVVYLDPMFPEREKSAAVTKEAQLLQRHERPAEASEEQLLLKQALAIASKRVIVKRPLHAPFLAEQKPSFSDKGKAIRYDIYLTPV
jgi:16S rRNA (guanine1516-N2)-methyltransferase